jgi:hypothetical protein
MKLSWQEAQHQINNNGKDNHAEGANNWTFGVNFNSCQGAGGEGDNGNNYGRLFHRLCFYFNKISCPEPTPMGKCKNDSRKSVREGACVRGRKPGTIMTTKVRAIESSWFLVKAKTCY